MLNQVILKIQRIPSLLLGFIVVSIVLIVMTFYSPATTVCDIQMEEVNARLVKGFFIQDSRGGNYESKLKDAYKKCLNSNSPGGCHDMFSRFDYFEGIVKTIRTDCGSHPSTQGMHKYLARGLKLLAMIAWGEKKPINKYNKTSWLDTSDLGLYCRLKRQYKRLYGKEQWKEFVMGVLPGLPEVETMQRKEILDLSLFTYPCKGLY